MPSPAPLSLLSILAVVAVSAVSAVDLPAASPADDGLTESTSKAAPDSPELPSQARLSQPASYRVDFRVAVTPPAKTQQLRVWVPLPASDDVQEIGDRELNTFPRSVAPEIGTEPQYGNTFAYFEFDSPTGAQLITHRFTATIHQADWQVDYRRVEQPEQWPNSFTKYRQDDPRAAESEQLREVMGQLERPAQLEGSAPLEGLASTQLKGLASRESSTRRLLSSMRWVDKNLTYDHVNASLQANPLHGLIHRRGHCSDYHGLCSNLARRAGYPSRIVYGLHMFDKASPSHCKLELFLPPYGWVSYDLSETQKLTTEIAHRDGLSDGEKQSRIERVRGRTMRGFRENSWLAVTRGTHYDLVPAAEAGPVPVVRTIYAEADGVPLPEPDPANDQQRTFAWMTLYRVDGDAAAKPYDQLD